MKIMNLTKLYCKNPNLITANLKWLLIKKWFLSKKLFVVQIGAGDGITSDPIRNLILKYNWNGILIEPQHKSFKSLIKNYVSLGGLFFENCIISDKDGVVDFNMSKDSNLSSLMPDDWFKGRNKAKNWDAETKRKELGGSKQIKVMSRTFPSLVKKYNLKGINLLVIDTEGYDFEIIKTIPFDKVKINMIIYEHRHLFKEEKREVIDFLNKKGYKIINFGGDAFAILKVG